MLISTRGRYALRLLADLALNQGTEGYITTNEIAQRQEVSPKYAERLMSLLAKNDFVITKHGYGGGYRLKRSPEDCRVSEILTAMDEELVPVACLSCEPNQCPRAKFCKTLPMWQKLGVIIHDFFDGITLADLIK